MAILACIDESEQWSKHPPDGRLPILQVLTYVAYLATPEKWQVFSDEWHACLEAPPRIAYLKMSDAINRVNEFDGWDSLERYNKIDALYKIMQRHISGGACFILIMNDFNSLKMHFPPRSEMRNKYFYSMYGLMHNVCRFLDALKLNDQVDFIFDEHTINKKVLAKWESFSRSDIVPNDRIGAMPRFEKDHLFPPLQAADLGAWVIGQRAMLKYNDRPASFPWESDSASYSMICRVQGAGEIVQHLQRMGVDTSRITGADRG